MLRKLPLLLIAPEKRKQIQEQKSEQKKELRPYLLYGVKKTHELSQ